MFDDRSKENWKERWSFYGDLVRKDEIAFFSTLPPRTNVNLNTFGKAFFWRLFGFMCNGLWEDPEDWYFDWILLIDNDIFMRLEGWDDLMVETWRRIDTHPQLSKTVQLLTQSPGGIMSPYGQGQQKMEVDLGDDYKIRVGPCGGSGLWLIKKDYFMRMGLLPIWHLKDSNKGHDILSWRVHQERTQSNLYAAGLWKPMALHVGHNHSICNWLHHKQNQIKKRIDREEKNFKDMTLDEVIKKYDVRDHQRW